MTPAIEVAGLCKVYRRVRRPDRVAVDGLDLSVPEGCVFGFLGPNGSGKTTTIRCILGLVRPSAGRVAVLGAVVPDALPTVIGRVGSIIETPQLFPTMTGRRNLALLGRLDGHGASAVSVALDRVGLTERADDLVKGYSLGMRQRLGLAAAFLKDPALLILDEPANGMDPAGIREIRLLLRALADEGRTVLVSSHLLSEVAQTCDQVATLLGTEVRRCLARRAVRVLVGFGVLMIVVVGVVSFATVPVSDLASSEPTPIRLVDLWHPEEDSVFGIGVVLLGMGALIGGALVVGGEWKAGTVTTVLTWEPRRGRAIAARFMACGVLATTIGAALAALLVVVLLPGILVKGTTEGADLAWTLATLGAVGRGVLLTGLSAVLGAAIASLGRSSTAALVAVLAYLLFIEPTMRAWWPGRAGWLVGENAAASSTGRTLEGVSFSRAPVEAGVVLVVDALVVAGAATAAFSRRDVAGGS